MTTSVTLSAIAAGTWKLTEWNWTPTQCAQWIEQCVALGVTTFDLADIYGSYLAESAFGSALREFHAREQIQIVNKCGIKLVSQQRPAHKSKSYDSTKAHIIASVEQSLINLQTDYLDLLLLHRPDPLMQPDDVADAFSELQNSGKVRAFGVSNFSPSQFDLLHSYFPLQTNQVQCSLLHLDPLTDGTFDQALRYHCKPMIWSPLGSGALFRGTGERELRVRNKLEELATHYQEDATTIALAWLLRHPAKLIPIIGSSKILRYQDAVKALKVDLSSEHWHALWSASLGRNIP